MATSIVSASKKYSIHFSVINMYDAQVKLKLCADICIHSHVESLLQEVNRF